MADARTVADDGAGPAWFDTVTGRYLSLARTGPDGHEWVTVAAADAKTLRTRLAEMLASVHAQAR